MLQAAVILAEGCLAQLVHNGIRQTLAGIFGFGRDAAIPCGIPLCDGVLHSTAGGIRHAQRLFNVFDCVVCQCADQSAHHAFPLE